jgi:replication initiation and membrane attachment protein
LDKIRRNDQFYVYAKAAIDTADYQVLSVFYLPVIGPQAFALFSLLCNLMNRQTLTSERYLHGDLESLMNLKLTSLETARHQLEAIGLLNVYFYSDCFSYEIKKPMSPSAFINDGILGQYLLAAVTESRFQKLLQFFKLPKVDKTGFINVTKSFEDVFPSITISNYQSVSGLIDSSVAVPINIKKSDFDFRLFTESIPGPFLDKSQLTEEVKNKIRNLSYVYGIDEIAMKDIFLKATNPQLEVDIIKLSRYARDAYKQKTQIEKQTDEINLSSNENAQEGIKDPATYFSSISPKKLLSDLSGGMVSSADLRIIERLIDEVKLDRGVVNVLVAYTVKNKDGVMPSFDYFEKVGMSWLRNQITSVESALDYVKHLNRENGKHQDSSSSKKAYSKNKYSDKPEVKIDWLESYIKSIE